MSRGHLSAGGLPRNLSAAFSFSFSCSSACRTEFPAELFGGDVLGSLPCNCSEKMPMFSTSHAEVKTLKVEDRHDHGDDQTGGSFSRLMRCVCSLEDMLKKLRWERSAVQTGAEEEILQAGDAGEFQMPFHYPRYSKADYESMAECKLDILLRQYGFDVRGDVECKR